MVLPFYHHYSWPSDNPLRMEFCQNFTNVVGKHLRMSTMLGTVCSHICICSVVSDFLLASFTCSIAHSFENTKGEYSILEDCHSDNSW